MTLTAASRDLNRPPPDLFITATALQSRESVDLNLARSPTHAPVPQAPLSRVPPGASSADGPHTFVQPLLFAQLSGTTLSNSIHTYTPPTHLPCACFVLALLFTAHLILEGPNWRRATHLTTSLALRCCVFTCLFRVLPRDTLHPPARDICRTCQSNEPCEPGSLLPHIGTRAVAPTAPQVLKNGIRTQDEMSREYCLLRLALPEFRAPSSSSPVLSRRTTSQCRSCPECLLQLHLQQSQICSTGCTASPKVTIRSTFARLSLVITIDSSDRLYSGPNIASGEHSAQARTA